MQIFEHTLGSRKATLTCYIQSSSEEIPSLNLCPAILIIPGGAYAYCSDREAEPIALAYLQAGYQAFVLRYTTTRTCPNDQVFDSALAEAEEAMAFIRSHAGEYRIQPDQVAAIGFSAGGHLAAALGILGKNKPDALVLAYAAFEISVHNVGVPTPDHLLEQIDSQTPPSFLFGTQGDRLVAATGAMEYATRLASFHTPYEIHIFASGDHGASLGTAVLASANIPENPDVVGWMDMSLRFLRHLWKKDDLVPKPKEVTEYGIDMRIGKLITDVNSILLIHEFLPELLEYQEKDPGCVSISLRSLQKYSHGMFLPERLERLDQELHKLNERA